MAGMGPTPKPRSRHKGNDSLASAQVRLPREGRVGEIPPFPLTRAVVAEKKLWDELWSIPQAVAWEELGWTRTVARYVRTLVAAEKPGATAATLSETRQLEDRLGLTPMSMLRLRWAIEDEKEGPVGELTLVEDERWRNAGSG